MFRLANPFNWFGPLFRFELVRLGRRSLHYRLRCGLGLLLLLALFLLYADWFPQIDPVSLLLGSDTILEPSQTARFAETFVFVLLLIQLGIVVLLTPALAAGSIVEEYQKQTITFLLASSLTAREIVLGKLAARLVFILGILLMFLPVMALMQLWGGVDIELLLAGYVVIGATALSLGGMSVYFAVTGKSLGHALFQIYSLFAALSFGALCFVCITPYSTVVSPFACLWAMFSHSNVAGDSVSPLIATALALACHGIEAVIFVAAAAKKLRRNLPHFNRPGPGKRDPIAVQLEKIYGREPAAVESAPPASGTEAIALDTLAATLPEAAPPGRSAVLGPGQNRKSDRDPLRVDEEDPLTWKEIHFPKRFRFADAINWLDAHNGVMLIAAIMLISVGASLLLMLFGVTCVMVAAGEATGPVYNPIVRWFGLILLSAWLLTTALRAAASVTREREKRTLETLLTLPARRSSILLAKWSSCLGCGKEFGIALAILGGIGVITSGLSLFAAAPALLFATVAHRFSISLGLWLSTISRNSLQAIVWSIVIVIGLGALPCLLGEAAGAIRHHGWNDAPGAGIDSFVFEMNPISCWSTITFRLEEIDANGSNLPLRLLSACAAMALMYCLSGLLWRDACRRFERAGEREF